MKKMHSSARIIVATVGIVVVGGVSQVPASALQGRATTTDLISEARAATSHRTGAKMLRNLDTGKCLKVIAGGKNVGLATCSSKDGNQRFGPWTSKIFAPDFGCVSANRKTWDVRIDQCTLPSTSTYGLNWTVAWGATSYTTIWNQRGCYLEGGNSGNFVRCSPGTTGNAKKWRSGEWG